MKKSRLLVSLIALLISNTGSAQVSDSMKLYIDEAVSIMEKNSLYSNKVNWKSVRDTVSSMISRAASDKEAEGAVVWVYSQLKDVHGRYAGIDTFYQYKKPGPERIMSKDILAQYQKPRAVKIMMLPGSIGYYKMPAVLIGSNREKMKEWANLMMDSLCKLNSLDPKAYIIDLRMNNGGNIEPMWQVLKEIIGEKNMTWEADAAMNVIARNPDTAFLAYQANAIPGRRCPFAKAPLLPVAVLIGPGTASSGEITALSFTTRKNSKLFGEPTIGVANSTNGFVIQDKGYLLFSVNYVADANKKVLSEAQVNPDVYISSVHDNFDEPLKDETVQAAMKWIKTLK